MTGATFPFPFSKHLQICMHTPKLFGLSCIMAQFMTTLFVWTIQVFILEAPKHTTLSIVMFKWPAPGPQNSAYSVPLHRGEFGDATLYLGVHKSKRKWAGGVSDVRPCIHAIRCSWSREGGLANSLFSTKQRNGVSLRKM